MLPEIIGVPHEWPMIGCIAGRLWFTVAWIGR